VSERRTISASESSGAKGSRAPPMNVLMSTRPSRRGAATSTRPRTRPVSLLPHGVARQSRVDKGRVTAEPSKASDTVAADACGMASQRVASCGSGAHDARRRKCGCC
jgi:hypothetical protein